MDSPSQNLFAFSTFIQLEASARQADSVEARIAALTAAGAVKVFHEVASGARTDRAQLRRLLDQLTTGDVMMVTRLDRLARSTLDLLHTLKAVADKGAGFRSLADVWADTTSAHGRLMLTILGGLAEFERELIKARTGEGHRCGGHLGHVVAMIFTPKTG